MLEELVLHMKQEVRRITVNPLLDAFHLEECRRLDQLYETDEFIKEKVNNCHRLLLNLLIDFHPNYRSAYEQYCEAITYLELQEKCQVNRVPEGDRRTPDFIIANEGENPFNLYAELKSLSYYQGDQNYHAAQQEGIQAQINIEAQLDAGNNVAFGEICISPFNRNGRPPTAVELIEIFMDKITNNLHAEQFALGDTILIVDIKQLTVGRWYENLLAIYEEFNPKSFVSGTLWNVVFGQEGDLIYKKVEYEGRGNIAGRLTKNGILVGYPFIKAVIFIIYQHFEERKFIGFLRNEDRDTQILSALFKICDLYNDDKNSYAFEVFDQFYR